MGLIKKKENPRYTSRRRRRMLGNVTRVSNTDLSGSKNIFLGVLGLVAFSLLLLGLFKVLSSEYFKVNNFEVIGARSISTQDITGDLTTLTGQNIFLLNSKKVETELSEKYIYFDRINVTKIWPNKLFIVVSEKQPLFFYNNLNGVYLVTEDGYVNEVIYQEKINFAQEQLNIITGAEGIESSLVKERLEAEFVAEQEKLPKEQRVDFDFALFDQDTKLSTLTIIRSELLEQARIILTSYKDKYDPLQYPQLESVYSFDNNPLKEGNWIDSKKLQLTREVVKFFSQKQEVAIVGIFWESKYTIKFETEDQKTLIFGTSRGVSEQIEDYLAVRRELELEEKNFSEMDLSSRKISVR